MSDETDDPSIELPMHDGVYEKTKELTKDADTNTTRRRLCQAISVLGVTSLAGCNWLGSKGDSTETDRAQTVEGATTDRGQTVTATSTPISSAADIDALINGHITQIDGKSYTVDVELQGPGTDKTIKKSISYKRSASGRSFASLTEVSTIDDGVESLTHYFGPNLHGVEIGFRDGSSNSSALDVSSEVLSITGASIFQKYLVGAAVAEPTDIKDSLSKYRIRTHSQYDLDTGFVSVGPDGVIRNFRLEWSDDKGINRWIDAKTYDVGATEVDRPNF